MPRRLAIPAAAAGVILACGVPLAWIGATPLGEPCLDTVLLAGERGTSDSRPLLWLPGLRCVSRSPDGRTFEEVYVAWYELAIVLSIAAVTWLVVAAALRSISPRRLLVGLASTAGVFLAASVAFFL